MVLTISGKRGVDQNTSVTQGVLGKSERNLEREDISDQFQHEGKSFYERDYIMK